MSYRIFHAQTFDKELRKFPKDFSVWVNNIETQLIVNPYVGDPIRVPWLREKKYGKYRIYYLIYDDLQCVYLVGISGKKNQQRIINTIWFLLDHYKEQISILLNK